MKHWPREPGRDGLESSHNELFIYVTIEAFSISASRLLVICSTLKGSPQASLTFPAYAITTVLGR